jgi:hypothetical protein
VLAVPLTAIYSRSDGATYVIVVKAEVTTEVTVITGRSGGGWVEVAAVSPGKLAPGDMVAVGVVGVS